MFQKPSMTQEQIDADQENAAFEEGITAEVVDETPKHDAVAGQNEDDEAPA